MDRNRCRGRGLTSRWCAERNDTALVRGSQVSSIIRRLAIIERRSILDLHSLLDQGVTVLTASRRLAHAIRLGLARHLQQQGLRAWRTPHVLPWRAWLRQLHVDARAGGVPPTTRSRVLTPTQARILWDDIVASSTIARDLLDPSNAARMAARSWRRLHDYLIPFDSLQSFDAPEAEALYAWCREFEKRCVALDALDETRLAHWAWDSRLVPVERIALAGFDAMPPAMTRLIERWREQERVVDIVSAEGGSAGITVVAATDATAELDLAAQWAREQVQAGAGNVGVIIVDLSTRREEVRRVFEDVFVPAARQTLSGMLSIPVVVAAPAPLPAYPMVDAALLVLQLAARECTSTDAGRLLRSPFIVGGQSERSRRALADRRLRDEQRDRWNWFEIERWAAVTDCPKLQVAARDVNAVVRGLDSVPASGWAENFHSLWQAAGWPGDRTLSSVEHQTLEKFHGVLAEFGALDAVTGRMNLQQALACLRDLLSDTQFEPETVGAAVTVIDSATSAGLTFDALWVTGLDADHVPAPVNPDALIPIELQRTAGIPEATASGVLEQATTQLQRWTRSAPKIVLSWPQRDENVHLARSPLLDRFVTGDAQVLTPGPTGSLRRVLFDQRPTLQSLRDDRAPRLASSEARGGARTVELQSRCAFRAQAEIRLRAEPMPRVSLGVEPVDRGALLHRVLAEVWAEFRTQERLLAIEDSALERQVRDSAQRHAAQVLPGDIRYRHRLAALEIESTVRQVLRLLALEKLRPPFVVRLAEASERYSIGGLSITLRPDRIDTLASGGELLIDYKIGSAYLPRGWLDVLPGRPKNPQLPLYGLAHADALRALAYIVLTPGTVEYRGWSDGSPVEDSVRAYPSGTRIDLGDPGDWQALMRYWRFSLTRLAEHYVAGEATVDPLPFECTNCHLSTFCRINDLALSEPEPEFTPDE
jgi:ATP-dependent helicase/nuclease subunit B